MATPVKRKMWIRHAIAAVLGFLAAKLGPETAARVSGIIDSLLG